MKRNNPKFPTLQSHTHCQAAQSSRTSQSLSKSVSFPTHGRKKKGTIAQHCIRAIAGEVVKSRSVDALTSFKYDPDDPNAISYKEDSEEVFRKKYPWSWTNHLKPKLQTRYNNFKMDRKFWALKKTLEKNKKHSDERYLD